MIRSLFFAILLYFIGYEPHRPKVAGAPHVGWAYAGRRVVYCALGERAERIARAPSHQKYPIVRMRRAIWRYGKANGYANKGVHTGATSWPIAILMVMRGSESARPPHEFVVADIIFTMREHAELAPSGKEDAAIRNWKRSGLGFCFPGNRSRAPGRDRAEYCRNINGAYPSWGSPWRCAWKKSIYQL